MSTLGKQSIVWKGIVLYNSFHSHVWCLQCQLVIQTAVSLLDHFTVSLHSLDSGQPAARVVQETVSGCLESVGIPTNEPMVHCNLTLTQYSVSYPQSTFRIANHVSGTTGQLKAMSYIDGLAQERRNSSANALELRPSCTSLSIYATECGSATRQGLCSHLFHCSLVTASSLHMPSSILTNR